MGGRHPARLRRRHLAGHVDDGTVGHHGLAAGERELAELEQVLVDGDGAQPPGMGDEAGAARLLGPSAREALHDVGLAGEGDVPVSGAPGVDGPLVIVVGSEDEGLARLVREHCDALVSIPIASGVDSLNASVAAAVALYEVSQQRSGITPSE